MLRCSKLNLSIINNKLRIPKTISEMINKSNQNRCNHALVKFSESNVKSQTSKYKFEHFFQIVQNSSKFACFNLFMKH